MAELVDALGLGSSEVSRGGSSPLTDTRGISLVGRASALHAEGQRFESAILHSLFANSE